MSSHQPTGRPRGRPTKAQAAAWKADQDQTAKGEKEALKLARRANWGGRRAGSGRPKKESAQQVEHAVIRLEPELATKLSLLPEGAKSEYLRRAIEWMTEVAPPETFKLAGKEVSNSPDNGPTI